LTDLGDLAAKPQLLVAQHVIATCLGGPTAVKAVGLDTWVGLTPTGRGLSPEDRQRWAGAITGAFLEDPAAVPQKPAAEVRRLVAALYPLDKKEAEALAYSWFAGTQLLQKAEGGDLTSLAKAALRHEKATAESRAAIMQSVEVVSTTTATRPLDFGRCIQVMKLWQIARNLAKTQEWTMKAYQCALGGEEARGTVSMDTLNQLGYYLYDNYLTHQHEYSGKGAAYPAFATALARHARQGTLRPAFVDRLSTVLATPETRQMLRDELLDSDGSPRFGVARLLAWAYRDAGELAAWRKFVDAAQAAAADADSKSLWCIVKAYTEVVRPKPAEPARCLDGLNAALAIAESEKVRLLALNEVVQFYRECDARAGAVDLVESVKGQFGPASASILITLQESLRIEDANQKADAAKQQAAQDRAQKNAQLRYLRGCLATAQTAGDATAAASLEKAIQDIERQLNP
jgi:hypothetical protein